MPAPAAIHLRFSRSFYIRHGLVGGMFAFICLVMMLMLKQLGPLRFLAPVVFMGPWLFFVLREYRIAARLVDEEGVTRHDGRRFLWQDLHQLLEIYMRLTPGQQGPLNQIDLIFTGGRARILYMVLENGWEAILFSKKKAAARMQHLRSRLCDLISRRAQLLMQKEGAKPEAEWPQREGEKPASEPAWPKRSSEPFAPPPRAHAPVMPQTEPPRSSSLHKCTVCGELGDCHTATQTVGREEEDTWLPAAGSKLKTVHADLQHPDHGKGDLQQCPGCGSWFFYRTVYEFLIPGSYDEQILRRISGADAEKLRPQGDAKART